MSRFQQDSDLRSLGQALATLRREQGLSQAEAGARLAMTSQGWGFYESGKRNGLFRPDVQRRLTGALGLSIEDLALAAARMDEPATPDHGTSIVSGVEAGSRAFRHARAEPRTPSRERMPLSNDDLAPWAVSGVVLEFDPERWPRRDQGCVIDLFDGTRLIRLYDRADADHLYLRGGPGGLVAQSKLERSSVARVAAITARLEM